MLQSEYRVETFRSATIYGILILLYDISILNLGSLLELKNTSRQFREDCEIDF